MFIAVIDNLPYALINNQLFTVEITNLGVTTGAKCEKFKQEDIDGLPCLYSVVEIRNIYLREVEKFTSLEILNKNKDVSILPQDTVEETLV